MSRTRDFFRDLKNRYGVSKSAIGGDLPLGSTITEGEIVLADNTTNNASTTKHGFLKKLSNNAQQVLNGQGNFVAPETVSAVFAVGSIGAADEYDKTTDGPQSLVAADPSERVVLIVVTVTETFADGDGSKTEFDIGETSASGKFATALNAGTAGDVFVYAGSLTATKALLITGTPATGTGTGAISVAALILPAAA